MIYQKSADASRAVDGSPQLGLPSESLIKAEGFWGCHFLGMVPWRLSGLRPHTFSYLTSSGPRLCIYADHYHTSSFLKVRCRFRSTFARSGTDFVAGQAQIFWQARHSCKVRYRFRGRRSTFTWSSTDFVAGAALSQG